MNELEKVFEYEGRQVRTVIRDGEIWFVGKDVCDILEHSNSRMALDRLDDDEKGVSSTDTLGGKQEMQVVNEPGLYSLILGSRKPEAKVFKRWVTHEVLPTIRQTGMYGVGNVNMAALLSSQQKLVEMQQETLSMMVSLAARVEALEKGKDAEDRMQVVKQVPRPGRRKSFKVEKLRVQSVVDELLRNSMAYDDVAEAVRQKTGQCIGKSSIQRYWMERKTELERMEVLMPSGVKLVEEKRFFS